MLSVNKQKAIVALMENPSQLEAAEALGVSTRTLQMYQKDPEFREALRAEINKQLDVVTDDLKRGMADAVYLLRLTIQNECAPLSNRQAAARTMLEYGLRYCEFNEIVKELRSLSGGS